MADKKAELMESLKKLSDLENSRFVLTIALFDKKVQAMKERKIESIKSDLYSKIYDVKGSRKKALEGEVDTIINEYNTVIDNVIGVYYEQLMRLEEYLQKAEEDQKYTINDLLKAYIEYKNDPSEENKNKISAFAQKKVNYDVIINECEERIELSIEEAESVIDSLVEEKTTKIATVSKENFVTRFFKIVKTFFEKPIQNISGKFEETNEKLRKIESFSNIKVKKVKYEILYFDAQMAEAIKAV